MDPRVRIIIEHDAAGEPAKLTFKVRDRADLKAIVRIQNGSLFFNLNLNDGIETSRALTGREVYRRALAIFGERVTGVFGVWSDGDNLEVFNWLTGRGWSLERAARETWTGRTSALHGFTEVTFDVLDGSPGHYAAVVAHFTEPRSHHPPWRRRVSSGRYGKAVKK